MPSWTEVLTEIQSEASNSNVLDKVRRKYLKLIFEKTNRNVIAYYSGWLQNQGDSSAINDKDKNAFMANIHGLDRRLGLDLILHTPGGDLAATESLIDYLRSMFGNNVRAIIPQISMSAGTLIALSCKEIMMGKQSNLGPIDPQMGGIACQAVLDEFQKAIKDITDNPSSAILWQSIISKYHPTFLNSCENAIDWSKILAEEFLKSNMFHGNEEKIAEVLNLFSERSNTKSHSRHISIDKCKSVGLNIIDMEMENELQDLILTVHHSFMHTFSNSNAVKIVENHLGNAFIEKGIES